MIIKIVLVVISYLIVLSIGIVIGINLEQKDNEERNKFGW
jgi:hypothetical protein